jgi:uncharacterized protein (TIGR02677 family)
MRSGTTQHHSTASTRIENKYRPFVEEAAMPHRPVETDLLFHHVTAEKTALYRAVLDVFARAKRQYRLQLRPDEVSADARWSGPRPPIEELNAALQQLVLWGNLEAQHDTARVSTLEDFNRARYLYRLSHGGEAVEAALATFVEMLGRRAELQSIALEDIATRLGALRRLAEDTAPDVVVAHETLRDLVRVFEGLADNAQAFMAGIARSVDLQQGGEAAVVGYKTRLIDYLQRFIGELIARSDTIRAEIAAIAPCIDRVLELVAEREARDAAPGDTGGLVEARARRLEVWRDRWSGLTGWFFPAGHEPAQSDLLRKRAVAAIPQLMSAITTINERRSGRSDRSADFRVLARWFAEATDDRDGHRLARAAFALNPARHFSLDAEVLGPVAAATRWADAPPLRIHPRLRAYGEAVPRGGPPKVKSRDEARRLLALELREEHAQIEAARQRLATGKPMYLSQLGTLDRHAFALFLALLAETLGEQSSPDMPVERPSGDGLLNIRLEPLGAETRAIIETPDGRFAGRDHLITVTPA